MKKILNYFNGTYLNQPTQDILEGKGSFQPAIELYHNLNCFDKKRYSSKLIQRICTISKPHKLLKSLLLLDKLIKVDEKVSTITLQIKSSQFKQKNDIAIMSLSEYFCYFLKTHQDCYYSDCPLNSENQLHQTVTNCEVIAQKINELFKIDFIMIYCLKHNDKYLEIIKETLRSILDVLSQEITYIHNFVDGHLPLILKEHICPETKIEINLVYQKLIQITKNIHKLETLNNIAKLNIKFPKYPIDKEINRKIELQMINYNHIKKTYLIQRQMFIPKTLRSKQQQNLTYSAQQFMYYENKQI